MVYPITLQSRHATQRPTAYDARESSEEPEENISDDDWSKSDCSLIDATDAEYVERKSQKVHQPRQHVYETRVFQRRQRDRQRRQQERLTENSNLRSQKNGEEFACGSNIQAAEKKPHGCRDVSVAAHKTNPDEHVSPDTCAWEVCKVQKNLFASAYWVKQRLVCENDCLRLWILAQSRPKEVWGRLPECDDFQILLSEIVEVKSNATSLRALLTIRQGHDTTASTDETTNRLKIMVTFDDSETLREFVQFCTNRGVVSVLEDHPPAMVRISMEMESKRAEIINNNIPTHP